MQATCKQSRQDFSVVLYKWLEIVKKSEKPEVLFTIREIASLNFKYGNKDLTLHSTPSNLKEATLQNAKTKYHAAFLVATSDIQQLIFKWHTEDRAEQRKALLFAIVLASKFDKAELYKFFIACGITNAHAEWFYEKRGCLLHYKKETTLYSAFKEYQHCTPEQFFKYFERPEDRVNFSLPNATKSQLRSDEGSKIPFQPAHAKPQQSSAKLGSTATTATSTAIASTSQAYVASVAKFAPVAECDELVHMNIDFYFNDRSMQRRINFFELVSNANQGDFVAIDQLIKKKIKDSINNSICCCAPVRDNGQLSPRAPNTLILEVKVKKDALFSSHPYNAPPVKYINKFDSENLSILNFYAKPKFNAPALNVEQYFIVADGEENLTELAGNSIYFFYDRDEHKVMALYVYDNSRPHNDIGRPQLIDFDELELPEGYRTVLDGIRFPDSTGGQIIPFDDITTTLATSKFVRKILDLNLNISLACYQIYLKFQQAKLYFDDNLNYEKNVIGVLQDCIKEMLNYRSRPQVIAKMEKLIFRELCSMQETSALLVWQGYFDRKSHFSKFPRDVILYLIQKSLDFESHKLNDLITKKVMHK